MTLMCESSLEGADYGDCRWFYEQPDDFIELTTKRSRRCCSCKRKIKPNELVLPFTRARYPSNDIEEKIYGDGGEIALATWFMCESCGDIAMNLNAIGYATPPGENMPNLLSEYVAISKSGSGSVEVVK